MKRSVDRILATHAGSLVRPPEIVEAMIRDHLREPVDKERFGIDLANAVQGVARKQAETGIDIIDDWEFGKSSWVAYVSERLEGLERMTFTREMLEAPSPVFPDQDRFGGFSTLVIGFSVVKSLCLLAAEPRFNPAFTCKSRTKLCGWQITPTKPCCVARQGFAMPLPLGQLRATAG